jgi:cellulose biosynthesis protein BcsQ
MNKVIKEDIYSKRNKELIENGSFSHKTISILNGKGGVGKSSIAIAITMANKQQYGSQRVAAVDLDPQAHTAEYNEIRNNTDYKPESTVLDFNNTESVNSIVNSLIEAGYDKEDFADSNLRLMNISKVLGDSYPIKIFDTIGTEDQSTKIAAAISDIIIIVTTPSAIDMSGTVKALKTLKSFIDSNANLNFEDYTIKILVNKVNIKNRAISKLNAIKRVKNYISSHLPEFADDKYYFNTALGYRVAYQDILEGGRLGYEFNSECNFEFSRLMKEFNNEINKLQ